MMTIAQAFDQFVRSLELAWSERDEADTQQKALRDNLERQLGGIARYLPSGSYSRGTAIRPLHDIDLFVILNRDAHRDVYPSQRTQSPLPCLQKIQSALGRTYPGKDTPRVQRRSVNIEFSNTGIGYDVVPAFEVSGDMYMIPDRGRTSWINTNPERHQEILITSNKRAGSKLNPLIKAVKRWKQERRKGDTTFPLRSFHLEVMSYSAFATPPASYPEGLHVLFDHLSTAVRAACADPAGVGPRVDGMTDAERDRAWRALREASAESAQALALEAQGRVEEAHGLWWRLLGDDYPERGRAPQGR